ncbi:MAG TPA: DinB family protein, partial [Vicinamibacteria bacterium]|nr:DinB family protein [Vicinamibacteria bacterium]
MAAVERPQGRAARVPALRARYAEVRAATLRLAAPLSPEDQLVQSMPDASPTKWHLAHTTWFFETFVLSRFLPDYRPVDARYAYLFNSYYEAVGPRQPRPQRGALTRPSLAEVQAYRETIDTRMESFLDDPPPGADEALARIELGLQHEQQHQELILTDIHHALWSNPLRPAYAAAPPRPAPPAADTAVGAGGWVHHPGGLVEIGD